MAKLPRVVAFIGPIGSGKTTAANCLKSLGYHRISFADPLKQMLMTLGLSHEQVYGGQKEETSPLLCGQTPRHAMQTLGTEWGRNLIHPDLWARAWQHRCQTHQLVAVDDMRFPNEYRTVKALNGVIVRINRPFAHATDIAHESEAYMNTMGVDAEVLNSNTLNRFTRDVLFTVQSF